MSNPISSELTRAIGIGVESLFEDVDDRFGRGEFAIAQSVIKEHFDDFGLGDAYREWCDDEGVAW